MPTPQFVDAGAGAAITGASGTVSKTSCVAGNLMILHVVTDGVAEDFNQSAAVNLTLLNGSVATDSITHIAGGFQIGSPKTGNAYVGLARVTANGAISLDLSPGASGNDLFARWYEISNASLGTTLVTVIENGAAQYDSGAGTGVSIDSDLLTSNGANRLGIQLVSIDINQALGDFTGETGGDWAEATPEFASALGTAATLQLQIAAMPNATTISGGSLAISSAGWSVIAFAVLPAEGAITGTINSLSWLS